MQNICCVTNSIAVIRKQFPQRIWWDLLSIRYRTDEVEITWRDWWKKGKQMALTSALMHSGIYRFTAMHGSKGQEMIWIISMQNCLNLIALKLDYFFLTRVIHDFMGETSMLLVLVHQGALECVCVCVCLCVYIHLLGKNIGRQKATWIPEKKA